LYDRDIRLSVWLSVFAVSRQHRFRAFFPPVSAGRSAREEKPMPAYILTGAPGSGKTAVLRLLETLGYPVVEEAATDVIALAHAQGHDEPWCHRAFVDDIVALQRWRRDAARPTVRGGAVFFDRSPVCTMALSQYLGFQSSPLLTREVSRVRAEDGYETTVFFVRNQGFVRKTAARRISFEESLAFERLHEETYRELGFRLVDVPAGPLAQRATMIEQAVSRLAPGSLPRPYAPDLPACRRRAASPEGLAPGSR
jgi:predicted ATPase